MFVMVMLSYNLK